MARVPLKIAATLVGICVLVAGCDLFTSPDERVARAEQLIATGDYTEALVELNVALEKAPDDARAQLALARVSLMLGSPDAATRALDVAQKSGADGARLAELRAEVLLLENKHEDLLSATAPGDSAIASPARELLRLRALTAQQRYPEVVELAHSLEVNADTASVIAVSLAEAYARLGNAAGALHLLEGTVKQHPGAAEAWLALGRLQQIDGRLPAAQESLGKALDAAGGQLTLIQQLNGASALAEIELSRGDMDAARRSHQRMVELAPEGALTRMLGARLTLADGNTTEAVAALQELVAKHAELDDARVALVSALLENGVMEQALQQASALAQKNPSVDALKVAAEILRHLPSLEAGGMEHAVTTASAHLALRQLHMARLSLRKAVELAPESPHPKGALAQLELRTHNTGEARRLANAVLEKQPDNPAALTLIAEAHRIEGAYGEAARTLERLWSQTPSAATALSLARVRDEGKLGNAPAALEAWVTRNPNDTNLRGAWADSLRKAGDNARAIAEFEKVLTAAPNLVPALNNLAWLYYLEKDSRAVATARRAWQLAPRSAAVGDTYGWLLVESGAVQEGLNVLESAWNEGGLADPDHRYHYAAALARAGQRERAAALLRSLLAEEPSFASRDAAATLAKSLG